MTRFPQVTLSQQIRDALKHDVEELVAAGRTGTDAVAAARASRGEDDPHLDREAPPRARARAQRTQNAGEGESTFSSVIRSNFCLPDLSTIADAAERAWIQNEIASRVLANRIWCARLACGACIHGARGACRAQVARVHARPRVERAVRGAGGAAHGGGRKLRLPRLHARNDRNARLL